MMQQLFVRRYGYHLAHQRLLSSSLLIRYHQPNDKKWICNFSFVFHSSSVGPHFHSGFFFGIFPASKVISFNAVAAHSNVSSFITSNTVPFDALGQGRAPRGTVYLSQIPLPIRSQIYGTMKGMVMVVIQIMFISYHVHFNLSLNYIPFALTSPSAHIIIM